MRRSKADCSPESRGGLERTKGQAKENVLSLPVFKLRPSSSPAFGLGLGLELKTISSPDPGPSQSPYHMNQFL